MQLQPPRWIAPVMAVVSVGALVALAFAVLAATHGTPLLWLVSVGLVGVVWASTAIGLIGTRAITVASGRVTVTGWRSMMFELDALLPPLEQTLFGAVLHDDRRRRRVFAQLPHLTSQLVAQLPDHAPQLRAEPAFPVVLPGRISTPVAYGIFAVPVAAIGVVSLVQGVPNRLLSLIVGGLMVVVGVTTLWWVLLRAERRVEVWSDRVEHVHLIGRRRTPLGPLAAAVVVTESRRLPKSSLDRSVHRLRLVDTSGNSLELAPMLAAFPDYGDAEGALMEARAWRINQLHGLLGQSVGLARTPHGDVALWDHSESSPGAHRFTLVLPAEVSGRRAVPLLHGRVAVGGSAIKGAVFDAVASHDDEVLLLLDLAAAEVRHVAMSGGIRELEPGFGRIVTTEGNVALAGLAETARRGWPRHRAGLDVPHTPWIDALELALAELDLHDGIDRAQIWSLVSVRAHMPLIGLLQPTGDESAPRLLAPILEVARLDDPLVGTGCPGSGRASVLGPEGRRECRTCGQSMTDAVIPHHDWPASTHRCAGSLGAACDRDGMALVASCRACTSIGPLTYDGLVRAHPVVPS